VQKNDLQFTHEYSTKEITAVQSFDFIPKFVQGGGPQPHFRIFDRKFYNRRKIF